MKKLVFPLLILLCAMLAACGSDDDLNSDGTKTSAVDQDDDNTAQTINDSYVYQLPVIFHVLYTDESETKQKLPASRFASLIDYVNEIYQGGIYGKSQNIGVKFLKASHDESGKKLSTPGVEYVKWDGTFPIDEYKFMNDNTGKYTSYLWDPNEYINVMVYPFSSSADNSITLGISHLPFTITGDSALEGLNTTALHHISKSQLKFPYCSSINSTYVGQSDQGGYFQSDRYTNPDHHTGYISPADVVVTLAHELGHYLGLHHDFTESDSASDAVVADSCADTDYCKDTPSYNRKEYLDYLSYLQQTRDTTYANDVIYRYNCDGEKFEADNIMDYFYTMGFQITADQRTRIRHVLYYSPLIPGPKKNGANTRAAADGNQVIDLRPMIRR